MARDLFFTVASRPFSMVQRSPLLRPLLIKTFTQGRPRRFFDPLFDDPADLRPRSICVDSFSLHPFRPILSWRYANLRFSQECSRTSDSSEYLPPTQVLVPMCPSLWGDVAGLTSLPGLFFFRPGNLQFIDAPKTRAVSIYLEW